MKIVIIGADGQLGTELSKVIPASEAIPLTIKDIDITDLAKSKALLNKLKPAVVINTAGYSRVDDCEDHEAEAFKINAIGVKTLADICRAIDSALVHISTDYVFDGEKKTPYTELDPPNPLSVYGKSKLAGEVCLKAAWPRHYIIRTTGLYGLAGCMGKGGGNFVESILQKAKKQETIKVVNDEVMSPTYAVDLARKLYQLVKTEKYGLYHIVNHGQCSWHEFAQKILALSGLKAKVEAVSSTAFPTKARRPAFSAMSNANLHKIGLDDLRSWPEALKAYLEERR